MKFQFEHTDTFGGESNYSWVKRHTIEAPCWVSELALVRRAKSWAGITGHRARVEKYGDTIAIYPSGICQVIFITYSD